MFLEILGLQKLSEELKDFDLEGFIGLFCKEKEPSTIEKILEEEYKNAILELERAWNNFNMVEEEYFEIANAEVNLAQSKIDLLKQKLLKL